MKSSHKVNVKVLTFLVKVINVGLLLTFKIFVAKGPISKFLSERTKFEIKEVRNLHTPFPILVICKLPGYKSMKQPRSEIAEAKKVLSYGDT